MADNCLSQAMPPIILHRALRSAFKTEQLVQFLVAARADFHSVFEGDIQPDMDTNYRDFASRGTDALM